MKSEIPFFIVRYKEDISWASEYLLDYKILPSTTGMEGTIIGYVYNNYESLPNIFGFLQGNPFDHCEKSLLEKLVARTDYTILCDESEGHEEKNVDVLDQNYGSNLQDSKYKNFDEFMNTYFSNYEHIDTLLFSPGSQFIVKKENILFYSKDFWKKISEEIKKHHMTETYIIERALHYIFTNRYLERC